VYALLIIGSLARHNSIIAAIPLVVLHIWPKAPSVRRIRILLLRGLVASVFTILVVFGVGRVIDSWVVHATKTHAENTIFLFDLVGISHRLNHNLVPGDWSDDETRKILNSCYSPAYWNSVAPFGDCPFVSNRLMESGIWNRGLFLPWARAVTRHPVYYAAHRLDYLHTLFWPQTTFTIEPNPESYKFGFSENWLFKAIRSLLGFMKRQFPFWLVLTVGFWMAMSCLLAGALLVRYLKHPTEDYDDLLVALSAALYLAPLVVIGPAGDFRYSYWSAGAACVAALLASRRQDESKRSPAPIYRLKRVAG
jgi:hypothetical protein